MMNSPPGHHLRNHTNRDQSTPAIPGHGGCSQLRLEIRSLAIAEGRNIAGNQRFYSSSKLRNVVSREKVLRVLNCTCSDCNRRIESRRSPDTLQRLCDHILGLRSVLCFNNNDALNIFALMTCIECPQLIAPLIKMQQLDQLPNDLEGLSTDFLRQYVWPRFDQKHPQDSRAFANEFNEQKYQFSVGPVTNDYQEFSRQTILPFINERSLDEGGFGKVCSFEIVDGYRDYLLPKETWRFARKQLYNPIPGRFRAERTNLELIRRLADPHLISIVKAYKHGDYFNFIFPCARTNLDEYLRQPQFWSPLMYSEKIQLHWFWAQMLGLAGAIQKIHSFKLQVPGGDEASELYGYHFDIKPANILVMDNGVFVVTDFGQANFKQKERGTSRVTGMGGTEAYAPPEFEDRDSRPNRKYDVWSLGCVFLEICTFIVLSYDGVNRLDLLKSSKSADGHREYESFYEYDKNTNSHRLKQTIAEWIESLPQSETVSGKEGCEVLVDVLAVVVKMLEVEVRRRMTSEEVYNEMKRIFQPYMSNTPITSDPDIEEFALPPEESELGPGTLSTVRGLFCSIRDFQFEGPIRMSENIQGEISVFTSNDQLKYQKLGPKTNLSLIPQYAFTHENRQVHAGSHLILAPAEVDPIQEDVSLKFIFRDIRKAAVVQSAILRQEVKRNLSLNRIEIRRDPQLLTKLLGVRQRRATDTSGRGTVQLWLAASSRLIDAVPENRSRRFSSRSGHINGDGLARRRIVLFCSNAIYTVAFSKAVRLKPREPNEAELTLHIVPTDKAATPSFTVSKIVSNAQDTPPAFPVDRTAFEHLESRSSSCFQCQSIALTFQCPTDVDLFWQCYQSMKEAWRAESALLENSARSMG